MFRLKDVSEYTISVREDCCAYGCLMNWEGSLDCVREVEM